MSSDSLALTTLDEADVDRILAGFAGGQVLALVPEAQSASVAVLQAAARRHAVELVGAVFPRIVVSSGFSAEGAWLVRLPPGTEARLLPADVDGPTTTRAIADFVQPHLGRWAPEGPRPTLFLMFDAMVPHVASAVDRLYLELSDEVAYSGANAGSETFQPFPCLFDADRRIANAVWALLLDGPVPLAVHGYGAPSRTVTATGTMGNGIRTIDWRPAFDVYRERVSADHGVELTRQNFYEYAVHFPFGILRARGDVVVRIPVGVTDDGTLYCVGEVPANAVLVLLDGPGTDSTATVRELRRRVEPAGPSDQLLTFYCAGRRMHLGDAAEGEVRELASGHRVLAGAVSLGEIGGPDPESYPVFHNAAIVATPWPGARAA